MTANEQDAMFDRSRRQDDSATAGVRVFRHGKKDRANHADERHRIRAHSTY
jgi:hypothetical protein